MSIGRSLKQLRHRVVDRRRAPVRPRVEDVRIGVQSRRHIRVADSLADPDRVDTRADQMADVSVPQTMKSRGDPDRGRSDAPLFTERVRACRAAVDDAAEDEHVVSKLAGAERHALLETYATMFAENVGDNARKRHFALARLALWRLEAKAAGRGLLERLAHLQELALEIDRAPTQRQISERRNPAKSAMIAFA